MLLFFPIISLSADFNVGKNSEVTISKIKGDATLIDKGRTITGKNIINLSLTPGAELTISENSEVWLRVKKAESEENSFVRFSTKACGSTCTYNKLSGVVSTQTSGKGDNCQKTQSTYSRAREIAGLTNQIPQSSDTASLVSFESPDTGVRSEKKESAILVNLPPGGWRDVVGVEEVKSSKSKTKAKKSIQEIDKDQVTGKALNNATLVPGSNTLNPQGSGGSSATKGGGGNNN
jgi:hypothetical protein